MSAGPRDAAFEPFSWHDSEFRFNLHLENAGKIKDLGYGVQKCLQLIEVSELERDHIRTNCSADVDPLEVPLLSIYDTSTLFRFAVTAAGIIGQMAEDLHDGLEKKLKAEALAASSTRGHV